MGHRQKVATAEMTEAHQEQNRTWYHQGGSSDFRLTSRDDALQSWLCACSVLNGEIWPPHAAMPAYGMQLSMLAHACTCLHAQAPNKDFVTPADNRHSILSHSVVEWETSRKPETHQSLPEEELLYRFMTHLSGRGEWVAAARCQTKMPGPPSPSLRLRSMACPLQRGCGLLSQPAALQPLLHQAPDGGLLLPEHALSPARGKITLSLKRGMRCPHATSLHCKWRNAPRAPNSSESLSSLQHSFHSAMVSVPKPHRVSGQKELVQQAVAAEQSWHDGLAINAFSEGTDLLVREGLGLLRCLIGRGERCAVRLPPGLQQLLGGLLVLHEHHVEVCGRGVRGTPAQRALQLTPSQPAGM